jgi:GWxTD domain-containing protein
MTKKALILWILTLLYSSAAWCIQGSVTHTVFYKKSNKDSNQYHANIALTWRVQNSSVHFIKNEKNLYSAEIVCLLRWSNETSIVKEESFLIKTPAKKTLEEAFAQTIEDQYEYNLPAADYEIELVLYEQNHKADMFQYTDNLSVPEPIKGRPFLSDVQLLDTSVLSNVKTPYTRNGYIDFPSNTNYISEKEAFIHYYYELYQVQHNAEGPFTLKSFISWKAYAGAVPNFEKLDTLTYKDFQYAHHSFPVQDLLSGNYYLNIVLSDKNNYVLDKKCLFFQRYSTNTKKPIIDTVAQKNTAKAPENNVDSNGVTHVLDLTATFVGKYSPAQVRAILKMMLLICDANEGITINGFLKKPDELYSKYFIYNFWEKRDKGNPERAWKAYTERIKEVNKMFGGNGQAGYESDRGRIYIQYGKPNDRVIVNNESGALPYEIWQYYNTEKQQREGVFLFYKPGNSIGGYVLLHSTLVGETRNNNWRTLLYSNSIMGSGNINSDSQAEQYIKNR